jgi:hypothetical protein
MVSYHEVRPASQLINTHRHSETGTSGIAQIFGLLGHVLSPNFSEVGGVFIGELVMHLFRKAGSSMGPILPDLLRALVHRITTAQMPSFIQVCPITP